MIRNVPDGTFFADRGNIMAANCELRRRDEGVAVETKRELIVFRIA